MKNYVGRAARYIWREKVPIAAGLLAAGAAWAGVQGHPDSHVLSIIPQTVAAASAAYLARRAGLSPAQVLMVGMTGAGAYEGIEHLNMIPPVNDMLTALSPALGNEFPGQRPVDIPVAGAVGTAVNYAGPGIRRLSRKRID